MTEKVDIETLLQESIEKGARQAESELLKAELDRHEKIAYGMILFLNDVPFDPCLAKGTWSEEPSPSKRKKRVFEKQTGWNIDNIFYLFQFNPELVKPYFKGFGS